MLGTLAVLPALPSAAAAEPDRIFALSTLANAIEKISAMG
jgi:hypothetical protein